METNENSALTGDVSLTGALQALLFVSDEPVNLITLAEMTAADPKDVQEALQTLAARLDAEGSGIVLREVAGGWRLYTNPVYHELVEQYVLSWDTRRLTQAAIETLAIIAYAQPITRQGIAFIRGVNSDSSVSSLLSKGLVREAGQADTPGYPMTYATTRAFLEHFGLRSVDDLPPLENFAPDEETVAMLREGLSAHGHAQLREDSAREDGEEGDSLYQDGAGGTMDAPVAGAASAGLEAAAGAAFDGAGAPAVGIAGTGLGTAAGAFASNDAGVDMAAGVESVLAAAASGGESLVDAVRANLQRANQDDMSPEEAAAQALRDAVSQAIAHSAGLVDKINFDEIDFEE